MVKVAGDLGVKCVIEKQKLFTQISLHGLLLDIHTEQMDIVKCVPATLWGNEVFFFSFSPAPQMACTHILHILKEDNIILCVSYPYFDIHVLLQQLAHQGTNITKSLQTHL